jgi:hypothetical protein
MLGRALPLGIFIWEKEKYIRVISLSSTHFSLSKFQENLSSPLSLLWFYSKGGERVSNLALVIRNPTHGGRWWPWCPSLQLFLREIGGRQVS